MVALVLKKFEINENANGDEDCIHIVGRQAGIMAWLLSLMKIDPSTEILCNDQRVEVTQASFFGRQTIHIPMLAVTGIVGGYKKPKSLFMTIPIVLIFGFSTAGQTGSIIAAIISIIIAAIIFVAYILKKEMSLYVQNGGDTLWGLTFKSSVIENVTVDINKVNEVITLITQKTLASRRNETS